MTLKFFIFSIFVCLALNAQHKTKQKTILTKNIALIDSGKIVYETYCLPCHQANGMGVPKMNPPLVKTKWVLGDKTILINILLKGLNDPIEIDDEEYFNPMPAHDFLSNGQIAAVLSYVRNNFGNKAESITVQEVKDVRNKK